MLTQLPIEHYSLKGEIVTPEERDRLVRLEEQVKNLVDEYQTMRKQYEAILFELRKLSDAFTIATSFGKGTMWTIMKVAGVIAFFFVAFDWVIRHLPFLK